MEKIFRDGAAKALIAWKQNFDGLDDLVNDLWVWYLESPTTQAKLQSIQPYEAVKSVKMAAMQMLSKKMLAGNEFHGRNLYSSDSVKDALLGVSTNRYLEDILPRAMEVLARQNEAHAEAIKSRYEDGVVPAKAGGGAMLLARAVKSLTEHVNVIAITAGVDADGNVSEGPGSRNAVFPEIRKVQGDGHSDPTGDTAVSLIEHGDDPIPLCATTYVFIEKFGKSLPQPIRDSRGHVVDSTETTTLRKEFVA